MTTTRRSLITMVGAVLLAAAACTQPLKTDGGTPAPPAQVECFIDPASGQLTCISSTSIGDPDATAASSCYPETCRDVMGPTSTTSASYLCAGGWQPTPCTLPPATEPPTTVDWRQPNSTNP